VPPADEADKPDSGSAPSSVTGIPKAKAKAKKKPPSDDGLEPEPST
jgi:cell division protease FtsH